MAIHRIAPSLLSYSALLDLTNRLLGSPSRIFHAKRWFNTLSIVICIYGGDRMFINSGYEEAPLMALPLEASDEPTDTSPSFTTARRPRSISPQWVRAVS